MVSGDERLEKRLEALEAGKRQRMEYAAMREFALKGYDHASTNRIVEEAGIAKGLLFHYFGSKKKLYLYLYDASVERITREIFQEVDFSDGDIFSRLGAIQRIKIRLTEMHPGMMEFLRAAYLEESEAVHGALEERNHDLLMANFQKAFEGIDTTAFREDLDMGMTIKTIAWAYEGFGAALMEPYRRSGAAMDYGAMLKAADGYAAFLKRSFYRPERIDEGVQVDEHHRSEESEKVLRRV